jgi:SNF2 family DNA or RNA helicase
VAFKFKQPPMGHQIVALRRAWRSAEFALFHEMGTGKTFTAINLAAARFEASQINGLIVICPTPIKNVWEVELEKFCPVDYSVWIFESGDKPANWSRNGKSELKVLVVGVEALSIKNGKALQAIKYFQRFHRCMAVVDESSRIKNWKARRTQNVAEIGGDCLYRMILTGTPVTQGLEDLFGQFLFLNSGIVGCKNYFVFRNKYCVMGGFQGKQVLGYQFQEDLYKRIRPYVDYVTKKDCLDLPDKVYADPLLVKPTEDQARVMKQLATEYSMEDGNEEITVSTVLERMLRYQQVIGGTFPYESESGNYETRPISGRNPKLEAMLEYIADLPDNAKVIIWARFVPEIGYIADAIAEEYGEESYCTFFGATSSDERKQNSERFQNDPSRRFMVSNQTVGGYGQTWTAATYVVYYSNTFSYEDRYQSESRPHRKGQENQVTYQDIEMAVVQDRMILKAIKRKKDLAKIVEESLTTE